jgi:hypothetical protein
MDNETIEYNSVIDILKSKFTNFSIDSEYEDLPYIIAGDFARYILNNFTENNTDEVIKCFDFIEALYLHGTDRTKELATIGFLEDLQNQLLNYRLFKKYKIIEVNFLGKETKKYWKKLEYFWNNNKLYFKITKMKNLFRKIMNNLKSIIIKCRTNKFV